MSMFNLAISCLTTSSLLWFIDLTFQVPTHYCSLQHHTLHSPADTFTTEHFHFGPGVSFFLKLLVVAFFSSLVAYWTPSDLGGTHLLVLYLFAFSYCSWEFLWQKYLNACHSLLQWTMSCQNPSLWPVHLGWPCMAWLISSLSFATTRLWSMKGKMLI